MAQLIPGRADPHSALLHSAGLPFGCITPPLRGFPFSRIGFGARHFSPLLRPESKKALGAAIEQGSNWIDFADDFADERAVENLAGFFQEFPELRETVALIYRTPLTLWKSPGQIEATLRNLTARMGLTNIDGVLLRLPAYTEAVEKNWPALKASLAVLEKLYLAGELLCYGVSSDGFSEERNSTRFVSLDRVSEARAPESKGFQILSAPFNLLEPGAALLETAQGVSPIDWCRKNGIQFLGYRPFNAWDGETWQRFASFPNRGDSKTLSLEVSRLLNEAIRLEEAEGVHEHASPGFAHWLRAGVLKTLNVLSWSSVLSREAPLFLANAAARYSPQLMRTTQDLLLELTKLTETMAHEAAIELESRILKMSPSSQKSPSLSGKTLTLLTSYPGVTGMACGLTHPAHVADLQMAAAPSIPLSEVKRAFQFVSSWSELNS